MRREQPFAVGEGGPNAAGVSGGRAIIRERLAARAGTRACLYAALEQVTAQAAFFAVPSNQLSRAIVLDDLCALFEMCQRLELSDAALACAVAEGSAALATLASILYSARRIGRTLPAPDAPANHNENGALVHFSRTPVPDVGAAIDFLQEQRAHVAVAPRAFITSVGGAANDGPTGAVLRLLSAAYGDDSQALLAALSGYPFSIDVMELHRAVAASAGFRTGDIKLLAAKMTGGPNRDAAFAAADRIEAVRALRQSKKFTLLRAIDAIVEGLTGWPGDRAAQDAELSWLREAARHADAVWATVRRPPPVSARVQTLLDGLLVRELDSGLTVVPRGCVPASESDAEISFVDTESQPVPASLFTALRSAGSNEEFAARDSKGPPLVVVGAPTAQAVAQYLTRGDRLARWTWRPHETETAVTAGGMTFSASRLNSFLKCSRRWFYEYLCAAIEEPVSMQAAYGRVMHAALEALHREIRMPSQHDGPDMLRRLLLELESAFGRARGDFASQLEYEVCRQRARRMAEQYVRWLEIESRRTALEIVHVELSHRLSRGGHQFVGYIDRIDRPAGGGPITIFDYKTGRIDDDAAEYLEKVRRGDEAQLALYYAMRTDNGDEVGRIALVSLRDPRDEVWILALDIVADDGSPVVTREPASGVLRATCSRADLDASFNALLERCDLLTKVGLTHFAVGDDPPCNYCAYNLACRERPADGERIFAR